MAACFGNSSEISKASLFVRIGLNGPRISAGASGFMSQRSSWLGPPRLKIMMQERFSWPGRTFPSLAALTYCGSDSPAAASAPTWRKSRRLGPLPQSRALSPGFAT